MSVPETSPPTSSVATRRCQWCSTVTPATAQHCPSCGSPTYSTLSTPAPGDNPLATANLALFQDPTLSSTSPESQHVPSFASSSYADEPDHLKRIGAPTSSSTYVTAAGIVSVCSLLGALVLPFLIVGPFMNLTGIEDVQASSLRGLGTLMGFVIGACIATIVGMVNGSGRSGH